ncbi:MxaD protein [Paramesorhizobium deserti]|uniref:MxaD protein n=1 Tax=Paramesorhizobium deserti TaxID=1494590 RepID=A0A135HPL0_9HYPH|nr:SRPBCC family protein [Paramesorhizobium deserti]KXF75076.1 MxaD protein [Paramesorhizobium deserti]
MRQLLAALFIAIGTSFAFAHGPTPQKVEEKVTIAASPEAIWAVIGDFANLAAWHPLVVNCTGTGGNGAGAERSIELKDGGRIAEGLDEYDAAGHAYSYRLAKENVEALPVSSYSATLSVRSEGGSSEVVWKASFYRADTGNYPAEGRDDAAATEAMKAFFRAGLDNLEQLTEARQ